MKDMYKMKLNEEICIYTGGNNSCCYVLRVPGGWIYRSDGRSPVFVPYHNEFLPHMSDPERPPWDSDADKSPK